MKILQSDRRLIYKIVDSVFKSKGLKPKIAEVGVLDGGNAEVLLKALSPERLYLIDSWEKDIFDDYKKNNSHRPWVDDLEKYANYFGGSLNEQSTFENLYAKVNKRFRGNENVTVIRSGSRGALSILEQKLGAGERLDYIYLDASHQYETVFDDLIEYQSLLDSDGIFQLNDCCHSDLGMKQNMGVLEAAVKFCKVANFLPVLATNTDWTDVLFIRKNSPMLELIDRVVMDGDEAFVEIPYQLLGAMNVRYGKKISLSFS